MVIESGVKAARDVTPSDVNTLRDDFGEHFKVTKGIYVGVAGDVEVLLADDTVPLVWPLDKGYHPMFAIQILDGNTTATGIKAIY